MTQPPPSAAFQGPSPVFNLNNSNRQVLTRKLALLLLKPLSGNPYRTIVLSGCSFGDAAASVAGPLLLTLARKNCLHTVILSDILASLPFEEALRSLDSIASSIGTYKRLCAVDLSHNAIGTMGMAHCAPLLQDQPALQVVNLENTGLSADAARLLCEYLTTTGPKAAPTTALRGLNIQRNRLDSDGMLHIATVVSKSPLLQCLRISSVGAGAAAVATLAEALSSTTDLRELDISDNIFDDKCASILSDTLAKQSRLVRLVLSDLNISDQQFHGIVDALMVSGAPLGELRMFGNELTALATDDLNRLLVSGKSQLSILDVSINELGDEGIRKLTDALSMNGALVSSPLTQVNVAENEATAEAIIHIATQLLRLPHLTLFDFRENKISKSISKRIAAAFPPSVVVLDDEDGVDDDDDNEEDETDVEADEVSNTNDDSESHEGSSSQTPPRSAGSNRKDKIELSLQALEALSKEQRSKQTISEPRSPRSQSEVTRLVQIFSSESTVTNTESEKPGGNDGNATPAQSSTNDNTESVNAAAEQIVPGTPPPSRFLGSITSPITPPPPASTTQGSKTEPQAAGVTDGGDDSRRRTDTVTDDVEIEPSEVVRARREEDEDVEMEDVGDEGNVILSARKLKESIVSLSKEISDVAGELEMPVSRKLEQQDEGDTTDTGAEEDDEEMNRRSIMLGDSNQLKSPSFIAFFLDFLGGLLVAVFIVVLVLAIVRSQEESTFRYVRV